MLTSVQASSKLPTNMLQQADQHWNWTAQCSCCGGWDQAKDRGHTHQEEAADSYHWARDVPGCCQQEQHRTAEDNQKAVPQPYCKYGHSHIILQFCHILPEVYFIIMFQNLAQSPIFRELAVTIQTYIFLFTACLISSNNWDWTQNPFNSYRLDWQGSAVSWATEVHI